MTEQEEGHNIPEWYIPDEEVVLANKHETKQIEEEGELKESLCPYCGNPYKDEQNGVYTHAYVRVEKGGSFGSETVWKPAILCVDENDKRYENGVMNAASENIR